MKQEFLIYIINPITGKFETPENWAKVDNPTSAEFVAIQRKGAKKALIIAKSLIQDNDGSPLKANFVDANSLAANYKPTTANHFKGPFRLPTRRECLDVYDARFQGLDDALRLIGGDPLIDNWIWTIEEAPDPEYYSNLAFIFSGDYGSVGTNYKYSTGAVRLVTTIEFF